MCSYVHGAPEIEDLLQKYEDERYFSIKDLTPGYFQVPLEEESR